MKPYTQEIADGKWTRGEVIERLRSWSNASVEDLLDDMAGAILVGLPKNAIGRCKAERLDKMMHAIAEELAPHYPRLFDKTTPHQSQEENGARLPEELETPAAQKYFARAIEKGYIVNGKWTQPQVRLGYFCMKVYENPRPINALEDFFGKKKLSASITQAGDEPKRADVKAWRKAMDDAIFYD